MADPLATRLSRTFSAFPGLAKPSGQITDIAIARAVAGAVKDVPGVSSLSRGHAAHAATYGPMQRVIGVMVDRPGADEVIPEPESRSTRALRIEVHVILSADLTGAPPDAGNHTTEVVGKGMNQSADAATGLLPAVAGRIRSGVLRTLQDMGLPEPVEVDIFIDDID